MQIAYKSKLGTLIHGTSEDTLNSDFMKDYRGRVDLVFTSPPFPLNRKKKYGNLQGQTYIDWLADFALKLRPLLKPRGSIVMEVGNAWEPGRPVMSTLALRALLQFLDRGEFVLCQQFIYNNPARLPGPAQWVTVERIRVKDSYSHLWWMAATDRPKATNMRVLYQTRPRLIAATTALSFARIQRCLRREGYKFFVPAEKSVRIRIDPRGVAFHTDMDVLKIKGKGRLSGSVVVRLPQHPARMLYRHHGHRCARAVRQALLQVYSERDRLEINEL